MLGIFLGPRRLSLFCLLILTLSFIQFNVFPFSPKKAKVIGKTEQLDPCNFFSLIIGVVDPECLSRILIFTHSGSRIPDPKTATKERDEKKLVVKPIFVATNFTKFKIILFFKC
jgi:hypothetical protein